MENIIKKYQDEKGYISDLNSLYNEAIKYFDEKLVIEYISLLYRNNKSIIDSIKLKNIELDNINKLKSVRKDIANYVKLKQKKVNNQNKKVLEFDKRDISFYIDFIESNLENEAYLNIFPKEISKDAKDIIDSILWYYVQRRNTILYYLSIEQQDEYISLYEKYSSIYRSILNYKKSLTLVSEDGKIMDRNEIVYYMNGDKSYIYQDIIDYPEVYEHIKTLLDSIENGTFKKIKYFATNSKLKGLLEVRDLANNVRVIFTLVGNKKYCVIGAIASKKETNSIYKERLVNRYSKYKLDKDNIIDSNKEKALIKILGGNSYE